MNSRFLFPVVGAFALLALGCGEAGDDNPLSISGEVTRSVYVHPGNYRVSPVAYHVKVALKNNTGRTQLVDVIHGEFSPRGGTALKVVIMAHDDEKGFDRAAYDSGPKKPFRVQAHTQEDWEFDTDGYTFDLLRDAGNEPLAFYVVFTYMGSVVAGPYAAVLPPLELLPRESSEKGEPLAFVTSAPR